jgi:threonyl-tRNA synthetase
MVEGWGITVIEANACGTPVIASDVFGLRDSVSKNQTGKLIEPRNIEQWVSTILEILSDHRQRKKLSLNELKIRLSRHDPASFEKYLGTPEIWKGAEDQLVELLKERGVTEYIDGLGEAAMYGPKLDFIAKDSIGRTLQLATIQLDFNQPKSFGLECTNEKGEKEQIVMIHCAIMGSIERFMSVLIEHYAGNFPLWLSPTQIRVLPVGEAHVAYAKTIADTLAAQDIRVELEDQDVGLGKKVRAAKVDKVPYFLIIGDKEIESKQITIESREKGNIGTLSLDELVAKFVKEIQEKA